MKKIIISLAAFAMMIVSACTNDGGKQPVDTPPADTTAKAEAEIVIAPPTIPDSETFYAFDSTKALVVANPISYDVTTKCYNKEDEWEQERVANTNTVAIANAIFQAVYKGRLTPYDYVSEEPMPLDSVKAIEKMFTRKQIGKIMFTEKWYFSEATLTFTKKVEQITLGYERMVANSKGEKELHGFKPAFLVKLNEAK
ncbi:MAG: hypothetical protein J6T96_02280 [Bacteroidales bacterium]|nr:hypothetical protein [Bacteroidales bacterium]